MNALRVEAEAIAGQRRDSIVTMTVDQRRGFLLELAEHVDNERTWPHRPFTAAVPSIVPAVASAFCADPVGEFDYLVETVHEFGVFNADERAYFAERDLIPTDVARERMHDRLQGGIDDALARLLGGTS